MGPTDRDQPPAGLPEKGELNVGPIHPRIPAWAPKIATGFLVYSLFVILWGAFVRASHSGDGCGPNWPFCNGTGKAGLIEFAHRMSSGMVLPMAIGVMLLAFRVFPRGTQPRKAAIGVLVFTLTEAAVGALLVLKSLVKYDASMARAGWMSVHLLNTFSLLGFMAAMVWHFQGRPAIRLKVNKEIAWAVVLSVLGVALLGVSGAITALGDTLFPAKTLAEAVQQDLSPTAHLLIRLRIWHPMIATSIGVMLLLFGQMIIQRRRDVPELKKWVGWLMGVYVVQMVLGLVNVVQLTPVWLQIIHLLAADALWLAVLGMAFCALQERGIPLNEFMNGTLQESAPTPTPETVSAAVAKPTWKTYLSLTKPRVISLLLFTTMLAMFIAKGGFPGWGLFFAVLIGGYAAAGAANTINMVIDRDIDVRMERTAKRPTVTAQISATNAMLFAGGLIVLSVGLLAGVANWLSAMMAMAGLLFYVFIYTLGLKRRTAQNIVIGGAAGSFPPLVGYAAVTNHLSPLAWVLFAIIFVWTPVHFWALSLLIKDEYAAAGIPMLPVVKGERVTVFQIGVYTILTALVSFIPLFQGEARTFYLVGSIVLNLFLIVFSAQLYQRPERPQALKVFKFSMIYLALLFVIIAIDRAGWM